jgi:hypothetical protein
MNYTVDSEVSTATIPFSKHTLRVNLWLVAVLACFFLLAWVSWGKLGDPIVDFGR